MPDSQLRALLDDEPDALASASNFVALLYNAMPDVNWLGIYVLRDDSPTHYLTRETYSRERVSTLIVSP